MSDRKICRLCLELIRTNDFESIENVKDILDDLLLNLNFDLTKDSVICKGCAYVLQNYVDLRTTYFNNCNTLSFDECKDTIQLNLREANIEQRENITAEEKCKFCLKPAQIEGLINIFETKENMPIAETLSEHIIPEVSVFTTDEFKTCESCLSVLKSIHDFILKCQSVEVEVKKYVELEGTDGNGHINLNYVHETKPVLYSGISCDNLEERANFCINFDMAKTEIKVENFIEDVKNEEIHIKSEHHDSDDSHTDAAISQLVLANKGNTCSLQQPRPKSPKKVRSYQCFFCPYQARYRCRLKAHMLSHMNPTEVNLHQCKWCTYATKRKCVLNEHMAIHRDFPDVELHKCDLCPFTTKQKSGLRKHKLVHMDSSEVKMHNCNMCPYTSKRKDLLTNHMLVHKSSSEIELYKCNLCVYTTKRKAHLKGHMLTHMNSSQIEMHECSVCSFKTKYSSGLKRHLQTHRSPSEIIRYQCELCPYSSKRRNVLRNHMTIHKNPNPIQ